MVGGVKESHTQCTCELTVKWPRLAIPGWRRNGISTPAASQRERVCVVCGVQE